MSQHYDPHNDPYAQRRRRANRRQQRRQQQDGDIPCAVAVVRRYGLLNRARLAAGRISRCTGDVPRGTADPPP